MESVEGALEQLILDVAQSIRGAKTVHTVTQALCSVASLLWSSYLNNNLDSEQKNVVTPTSLDQLAALCTERATIAHPEISWKEILNRVFFGGQFFGIFAQLLLQEVAVHWLPCFSLAEQKTLFDEFFIRAPLSEAILELIPALSQEYFVPVRDEELVSGYGDSGSEAFVADDIHGVIRSQAERLLAVILITTEGVKKLTLSLSSTSVKFQEGVVHFEGRFSAVGSRNSEIAQVLSSVPDRASLLAPSALQSPVYFEGVTKQLFAAAEEYWKSTYGDSNSSQPSVDDPTIKFVGEVLAKLCRRGQGDVIASQMVPSLVRHVIVSSSDSQGEGDTVKFSSVQVDLVLEKLLCSFWPSLAFCFKDSYALERLTEALLREMAARADLTDWQAYCVLHAFYGNLFQVQIAARALFTEKLLLWKVLPLRCLRWILVFSVLCYPPTAESSLPNRSGCSRIQKDVVMHLVEAWAMKEFVQSTPVEQQAYVTAAVGLCLGAMNRNDVQSIGGFVQCLLKGISNRLDSPLHPVRQMAKRIALAFSLSMDSSKPLLLDEEDTIQELKNWEGLIEMVGRNVNSVAPRIDAKVALDTNKLTGGLHTPVVPEQGNDFEKEKFEQRRRRKEKKEKLALEEDDPDAVVTLDEHFSYEDSELSSDTDSESDSEFVPYDMPEEVEDNSKVKAPTQLDDCATYLRKVDNLDMVEKALQVVEKLVLAMPEELDQHAADLAHALLHVKCSSVAVEGEEDVAERRQRQALVVVLSCSPVKTVTALTAELFSPHIDVSQRILILEVMAAGARAIASGVYVKKKASESREIQLIADVPTALQSSSWMGPGGGPRPRGAGPWKEVLSPLLGDRYVGWGISYERELPLGDDKKIVGTSRKWGHRSMQLREEGRIQGPTLPRSNTFAALAPMFMLPVMREYDVKRHGVDLLGRDYLVLGSTLSMLAECMKCIAMQPEAALLGAGLLELLRSREISTHKEPFVRRAALFAAACVMGALNPSDVVASLTGGVASMANNLEWVREWALNIANKDSDKECSMVAMACVYLHSEMAMQAMRSMETFQVSELSLESKLTASSSTFPIIMPFEKSPNIILGP
ncbi:hypothetical protein Mapa_004254 [Marchantia paleacea]|nr:hypothetical protein Mapa_004254 [Marchantia paleacea]